MHVSFSNNSVQLDITTKNIHVWNIIETCMRYLHTYITNSKQSI